ncbi:MAG: RHS repeat-associated core domain-containing protein [Rhodanobacteraceae bacterium]|nr:RHS repeat-associated core domain-containing protein [Rhodanobacteraceae bacterium]
MTGNRQTARQLPLGQRETMSYNAAGEQFAKLTFNNEAIAMAYDEVSRPRTITLPDRTRSFSYTASGQIRQIVDGSDTWTFAYDARDRLKRAEDAFGRAIDYDYDAAGNRTELKTCASVGATCTSRQVVQYAFDDLNRLREVVATLDGGVPQTTQYRYSDVGSRSGMTHPNGTVVDYTYDARNRLKTVRSAYLAALVHKASAIASAATLLALSYTVDASGLRTQIAEERPGDATTPIYTRVTDYTYDAVQRLTREQVSGNHGNPDRVHTWTYDAVGNRLTQIATVGAAPSTITSTTTYDYDSNDRLLSEADVGAPSGATTTTHTYDAAGNLTATREGTTTVAQYTWDAEGRLSGAVLGNGPTQKSIAYRYDPNGIRRSQQVTEASGAVARTEYLVDPNQAYAQVLEEWTSTAAGPLPDETLATTYVYGDDLISQTKLALAGPSVTSVYHYDGLGTTRALSAYKVDAAGVPQAGHGEITDRYAYTAFGESDPAGTSGDTSGSSENNYRYTGEQLDPNLGFYYLRARYMDPSQGRFVGMDSFVGDPVEPLSLHRYAYANLDPADRIDPHGRFSLSEEGVASDIRSILANLQTDTGFALMDASLNRGEFDPVSFFGTAVAR